MNNIKQKNHEWWVTRYCTHDGADAYLETYKDIVNEKTSAKEVDLVLTTIKSLQNKPLKTDSAILDGFCGNARHAKELFALGYKNVTCFDFSEEMLKRANNLFAKFDNKPIFRKEDARDLKLKENSFDIYSVFGNSVVGFFDNTSDDNEVLLESFRVLKPNGFLAFDLVDHDYAVDNLMPHIEIAKEKTGSVLRVRHAYYKDMVLRVGHQEYRFPTILDTRKSKRVYSKDHGIKVISKRLNTEVYLPDGAPNMAYQFLFSSKNIHTFNVGRWVYTNGQVVKMLKKAGFEKINVYPRLFSYNSASVSYGTMGVRNVYLAQKS